MAKAIKTHIFFILQVPNLPILFYRITVINAITKNPSAGADKAPGNQSHGDDDLRWHIAFFRVLFHMRLFRYSGGILLASYHTDA